MEKGLELLVLGSLLAARSAAQSSCPAQHIILPIMQVLSAADRLIDSLRQFCSLLLGLRVIGLPVQPCGAAVRV